MKRRRREEGLTMIEMLVGMALIGVVMAVLLNVFSQGTRISTDSSGRADLQQEMLNAQQLLSGRLREAYQVFPVGTALNLGSGALTSKPGGSGGTWSVGSDPILALVLPPRVPGAACPASGASDGCYRFFAYYPVLRSAWVAAAVDANGKPTANHPGADDSNDSSVWVMVEYRNHYPGSAAPPATLAPPPQANRAINLLADYVAPSTLATAPYTMFEFLPGTAGATVQGVRLSLATQRTLRGRLMRFPGASDEYTLASYPTNLGKVAVP